MSRRTSGDSPDQRPAEEDQRRMGVRAEREQEGRESHQGEGPARDVVPGQVGRGHHLEADDGRTGTGTEGTEPATFQAE